MNVLLCIVWGVRLLGGLVLVYLRAAILQDPGAARIFWLEFLRFRLDPEGGVPALKPAEVRQLRPTLAEILFFSTSAFIVLDRRPPQWPFVREASFRGGGTASTSLPSDLPATARRPG